AQTLGVGYRCRGSGQGRGRRLTVPRGAGIVTGHREWASVGAPEVPLPAEVVCTDTSPRACNTARGTSRAAGRRHLRRPCSLGESPQPAGRGRVVVTRDFGGCSQGLTLPCGRK